MLNKIFYTIYHANLAFSAIEESEIPHVIDKCYFPLLELVKTLHVKVGLELSGFTLEKIQYYRPEWITQFKHLCNNHAMELIGSGYMQIIGPLVPYEVNIKNQRIGLETYHSILGITPCIAYINEQTFSQSMIDIYQEVGYQAIAMEWNNAFSIHPKWKPSYAHFPAIAQGIKTELPIVWTDSILFQQFQKTVHHEQTVEDYLYFFHNHISKKHKCIPIYSSDLEIFNYRPGRFETEATLLNDEWERMKELISLLNHHGTFELPSSLIQPHMISHHRLSLTTSAHPIIVKKQDKYSLGRWAACGHDANYINTLCYNVLSNVSSKVASKSEWKELLQFWGSDYRTHTTLKKWSSALHALHAKNTPCTTQHSQNTYETDNVMKVSENHLVFEKEDILVSFLPKKGMALESMHIKGVKQPFGTIKHGEISHIGYVADFFTGTTVIESAHTKKITDLVPISSYHLEKISPYCYRLNSTILLKNSATEYKSWTIDTLNKTLTLTIALKLPSLLLGSIRLGAFTLLPQKQTKTLAYWCKNGGQEFEHYALTRTDIKHHLSKSLLQSSSGGIGATSGEIIFTCNNTKLVTLYIHQKKSSPFIMLQHNESFKKSLTRLFFSVQELDDTLKHNEEKLARTFYVEYTIKPELKHLHE